MFRPKSFLTTIIIAAVSVIHAAAADTFVTFSKGAIPLCSAGEQFQIAVSDNDNVAVKLAAKNLVADFSAVCDAKTTISSDAKGCRIVIGTLGTPLVNDMIKAGKINPTELKGKREKYIITAAEGQDNVLYIVGSDRRGTVYGIYELSRQIGVSPWYYWMDAPVRKQQSLFLTPGQYTVKHSQSFVLYTL